MRFLTNFSKRFRNSKRNDLLQKRRLGDVARDRRDWQEAARIYSDYLDVKPTDAAIWVQYGHVSKEHGDLHMAEKAYVTARELLPNDHDIHLQYGHLLKLTNRFEEAATSYRKAVELLPSEEALIELANVVQINERNAAIHFVTESYENILKRSPDSGGLDLYVEALLSREIEQSQLIKLMLQSEEFGSASMCHSSVAKFVAGEIIGALMCRRPSQPEVEGYSSSLQGGYSVEPGYRIANFLHELTASDEFVARFNRTASVQPAVVIPAEIGRLVESLIMSRMEEIGCAIPSVMHMQFEQTPVPESQMRMMLYTLSMLESSKREN